MFYSEILYLGSCTNPTSGKIFVPEIWTKMFSASQIAGIFNQSRINHWNGVIFCWYKFTQIKSWSENVWVGMVKNRFGQSGYGTLKLAVSQEWIDGINRFFACWCKCRKAKSYFTDFWVGMVKNGYGHLFSSWDS